MRQMEIYLNRVPMVKRNLIQGRLLKHRENYNKLYKKIA
jgi:hypothetical protein